MSRVRKETVCKWTLSGNDNPLFLSAMAKIWKEINRVGFADRMDLTRNELDTFNDVIEQLAILHKKEQEQ